MQQEGRRDNKDADGDGLLSMRNSLPEPPNAREHEYVMKAPVTPAVSLGSACGAWTDHGELIQALTRSVQERTVKRASLLTCRHLCWAFRAGEKGECLFLEGFVLFFFKFYKTQECIIQLRKLEITSPCLQIRPSRPHKMNQQSVLAHHLLITLRFRSDRPEQS